MNGVVLLDEEQQRTLRRDSVLSGAPSHPVPQYARAAPRTDFTSRGSPRTDFRTRGSPRTDFTSRPSPRTDFTTRGSPRTDFTTRGSPRTDFTTREEPRTDYTTNQGLPRTNFTTQTGGARNPRTVTHNNSPRTDFTTRPGTTFVDAAGDSYPILRRSDVASSIGGTEADSSNPSNRYAGTSSGLKISVTFILIGVALGVALGIVLSRFKVSALVAQWVSLPGDLFLRALKCLVVPYVFTSVAVAIGDIVFVGKVSIVGMQTAKIFVIFWVCTTTMGTSVALLFRPLFRLDRTNTAIPPNAIGFMCENGLSAVMDVNSSISCAGNATDLTREGAFIITDVNDVFVKNTKSVIASLNLSDQLMSMITPIVSNNIISSLANAETLSIITFSMVLGSIAGRNYFTKTRRTNYLYLVLLQLRNTFFLAMEWVIWLSPVAVISIIAGSFATNQDSLRQVDNVYVYVLAMFAAAALQTLVLFPAIVFLMTRCNPYNHMAKMVRAYVFAFACSSSLATAPVTLGCIRKAKVCSQSLANFVISIGVTSNVSAVGFYIPIAVVFIAESSGNGGELTLLRIVGIYLLALLSCAGTPPIPASGLATITTIYTTLFGVSTMPETFSYVIAMDFLLDRFSAVCDVNDDIMALKVIAENTDETVTQEYLGERY